MEVELKKLLSIQTGVGESGIREQVEASTGVTPLQLRDRQQSRRAAPQVDRFRRGQGENFFEPAFQMIEIGVDLFRQRRRHRVKGAVSALAVTERQMEVVVHARVAEKSFASSTK